VRTIFAHRPDIIGLQECNFKDVSEELEQHYQGIFINEDKKDDKGVVALFWSKKKFRLPSSDKIVVKNDSSEDNIKVTNARLHAIIALLKYTDDHEKILAKKEIKKKIKKQIEQAKIDKNKIDHTETVKKSSQDDTTNCKERSLCVVVLQFKTESAEERMNGLKELTEKIKVFTGEKKETEKTKESGEKKELTEKKVWPVIIVGDFNTTPHNPLLKEFKTIYDSAYDLSDPDLKFWTTWKKQELGKEVKEIHDYIWYDKKKVRATHILPPIDKEWKEPLPTLQVPSDHIMLAAKLLIMPLADRENE